MSFVLNLQIVEQDLNNSGDPAEPASLSFLSPVTCYSSTSVALC